MKTWIIYWLGIKIPQALAALGDPPPSSGIEIKNPLSCSDAAGCLNGILAQLRILAIPVVGVIILIGGFQIMSSGGNEEKLKSGKNTIVYAAVGYAIILLAGGIAAVINDIVNGGAQ